jgi:hypothetical protein
MSMDAVSPLRQGDGGIGRIGRVQRWFVSSNGSARDAALDSQLAALPIRAPTIQPTTALLRLHPSIASNRSPLPLRANLLHLHAAAKSP